MIGWNWEEILKLTKTKERKYRDLNHARCIESDNQKVLVKDDDIKQRLKGYFNKLLDKDFTGEMGMKDDT